MKYDIRVYRQDEPNGEPYVRDYIYEGTEDATIAQVLEAINAELAEKSSRQESADLPIEWECSCRQKVCGACAMVINRVPGLACSITLRDCNSRQIVLEPLSKFPVVKDLKVDRSRIANDMTAIHMWLNEAAQFSRKSWQNQYLAAKCMKCGLCLEICPNYGEGSRFLGAVCAQEAYLAYHQSRTGSFKRQIRKTYRKYFSSCCSKDLSCHKVCPAQINLLSIICGMNRH